MDNFSKRNPDFPKQNLLHQDYFDLHETFDLIIEQTFFCAIDPILRKNYVQQSNKLLKPYGKLVGLLFDFPFESGPPFGGNVEEYQSLFAEKFIVAKMNRCYNSINPRLGNELFIELIKIEH